MQLKDINQDNGHKGETSKSKDMERKKKRPITYNDNKNQV